MCPFTAYLHSPELLDAVRLKPNAFVRHRKLPFVRILSVLLSGLTASLQTGLNVFAAHLDNRADLWREVSAQAFSKARLKFSHRAFALLNARLLDWAGQPLPGPRWHGFRRVAADASKLQLFLKDAAGRKVREAVAFALYLPGHELTLSFEPYSPAVGERQMLFEPLKTLKRDDLLLLDRGYPAQWLIAVLYRLGIPFCLRVDATGFAQAKALLRSGKSEAVVTIAPPSKRDAEDYECPRQSHTVRLVRVVAPDGKQHVLMTSLLDADAYPAAAFAGLYHTRWRIEEAFKRLKHRLKLEQLSGISWLAAQQDFGVKVRCDNLKAVAVYAADPAVHDPAGPNDSHYQPNRTYGFTLLKRYLPRWLLGKLPSLDDLLRVLAQLLKHRVRFVPDQSKPRPKRPKPHAYIPYKAIA